jgi:hypothetical protein
MTPVDRANPHALAMVVATARRIRVFDEGVMDERPLGRALALTVEQADEVETPRLWTGAPWPWLRGGVPQGAALGSRVLLHDSNCWSLERVIWPSVQA